MIHVDLQETGILVYPDPEQPAEVRQIVVNTIKSKIAKISYSQIVNMSITPVPGVNVGNGRATVDMLDIADTINPNRRMPASQVTKVIDSRVEPAIQFTGSDIDTNEKIFDLINKAHNGRPTQ